MNNFFAYMETDGVRLFTAVCLPKEGKKFPVVIFRSPYVDEYEHKSEEEVVEKVATMNVSFIENGYAVVFQHCRGRGKSEGDCIPYIHEREDGLALQRWIREQDFYNGELYLCGGSYTSSVHFTTAPFASDIKGAVLKVQDSNRYNCNYRNGFYKIGLHGGWYVNMYKRKSIPRKNYVVERFHTLPLSSFSQTVFGEPAEDFDEILRHPNSNDDFWKSSRFGGAETLDALNHARIPILLTTGFYDIYTGGVFDMWKNLDEETKRISSLIVHPYDHGGGSVGQPVSFQDGCIWEYDYFQDYQVRWFNAIRRGETPFVETGKVTYYKLFKNEWCTDEFETPSNEKTFTLGEGEKTYLYDPHAPASFKGGLSTNFGGAAWQDAPNSRYDIVSVFTPKFEEDTLVKGKMKVKLRVRSTCEDTCFYVRISLDKQEGAYGLRDDIHQISNFCANYQAGEEVELDFSFDEHAFLIQKGESLRVDISSSAFPLYVRHTNRKGLFSEQTSAQIAYNTIILDKSTLTIFCES